MSQDHITPYVGIGLIGSGFMGKCHANAFGSVAGLFDVPLRPQKRLIADMDEESATRAAQRLGFERGTANWNELVTSPDVDIVAITAPNVLHEPMALAAIAAGKTVYCEKPLSITSQSARRMTEAAEAASVITCVGFNFQRNPMVHLAKALIAEGEIGEVTGFRGRHAENYMADPNTPHSFRTDPQGGGAVADIGSHIVAMASLLLGPIDQVSALSKTIHKTRPIHHGSTEQSPVVVDDVTYALVQFQNGVCGTIEANWAATGRTMDLSFEVTGTRGAIHFSQERMNELWVHTHGKGGSGFRKIETGPEHPPYGAFCPAAGHHLGFNDLKVIEVAELLDAHANDRACYTDFRHALYVQTVIEAIQASAKSGGWTACEPV